MTKAKAKPKPKAKPKSSTRTVARSRPRKRHAVSAAKAKGKLRPKQRFIASHLREEDFQVGLRSYAKYRDLGIAAATGGMVQRT
jgi:hypothetical protein